jgi:3-hydroxyisobutyrate dehydrogenase-like beta-hydroxyacid dehydrogenase
MYADDPLGLAMAANIQKYLTKEGYPPLIVYNRTVSRADSLKELGVVVAHSIEEAVPKADIVFTTVRASA